MPKNAESTSSLEAKSRRVRRPSLAPREVVLGLDRLEQRVSFFGAGVALLLALLTLIQWIKNTTTISKLKPSATNACLAGYHHVGSFCEEVIKTTRGQWEIRFAFIAAISLCILYFAIRRKRAGVACFTIFLGLGLGITTGLLFFLLGAWLIMRAYRLQKYGDASFFGSNRVAKEAGQARREQRRTKATTSSVTSETTPRGATPPSASKRYTPKKPQRRR